MSSQTNLYNFLVQKGDYTRSYDDFQTQFASQDSISNLYNFMAQSGDYTKSFEEFDNHHLDPLPRIEDTLLEEFVLQETFLIEDFEELMPKQSDFVKKYGD